MYLLSLSLSLSLSLILLFILVEWCRSDKFTPIVGDFVMTDLRSMEYTIPDLNQVS